jgi:hypothetical protein
MERFADKLTFLAKALSISRGQLGKELAVDKSVVSRWLSGARLPTSHNMAALTALVARRVPDFTALDWERDHGGLAALVGRTSADMYGGMDVRLPGVDEAREAVDSHAQAFEGHWAGYRQTFREYDQFVQDVVRIRRRGDLLSIFWGHGTVHGEGWLLGGDGKAYALLPHQYAFIPAAMMLYTVDGSRIDMLDGLLMTTVVEASRDLAVVTYALVRQAELIQDEAEDDAYLDRRMRETSWSLGPEQVPPAVRNRLSMAVADGGRLRLTSGGSLTHLTTLA